MPSNIELNPVALPVPQSTVGSQGRTAAPRPDFAGALGNIGKGIKALLGDEATKAEAESGKKIIKAHIEAADPASAWDELLAQKHGNVDAAIAKLKEDGVEVGDMERQALLHMAEQGQRMNDAIVADPSAARRINILKAKELYNQIDKFPHLALEFRSLIYGDNNFITSLLDQNDAGRAQAAIERAKTIGKIRDERVKNGHTQYANMSDDEVLAAFEQDPIAEALRGLERATVSANTMKARRERGEAVSAENFSQFVVEAKPGMVYNATAKLDSIITNPALSEAEKQRQIEAFVIETRAEIAARTGAGATEIDREFSDLLTTIPDAYRKLGSSGPERAEAENTLAIYKAQTEYANDRKYNLSTINSISETLRNLKEAGVSATVFLKNRKRVEDLKPINDWFNILFAEQAGDSHPRPGLSTRTDRVIAEEQERINFFIKGMMKGYDRLDPASRVATSVSVINALTHPDNKRSDAGMDKLMVLMASPEFKSLAQSDEFKTRLRGEADDSIGLYLEHLNNDVGKTLSPIASKITPSRDADGVLTLTVDASVEPKMRDAVARLQNRLRNVIYANANLYGQTPAEASRDFEQTYLAQ